MKDRGVLAGPKDVASVPEPPPSSSREVPKRSNTSRSKLGRSSRRSEDVSRTKLTKTKDDDSKSRGKSEDKLRRSDDKLSRSKTDVGETSRSEEARRKARQEERMKAKEKEDDKKSGFRAAFKRFFTTTT